MHRHRPGRNRRRFLIAGAVVGVGALFGTGFSLQAAMAAQEDRVAATAALATSTGLHPEQTGSHSAVLEAHAEKNARDTLSGANQVIAAAQGKTDATSLATSVASLSNYALLAPERVFALVGETQAKSAVVQTAVAEVDRVAAEQAAAAAAAAAARAAAAEQAAKAAAPVKAAASRPSAPTDPTGAQLIARDLMAAQYGWGEDQFACLVPLWARESGWNVNAYNSSSGATGIPQALPGSKMASAGADWQTNPATQITWGLGYISGRYGTPCAAWDHSESAGWY
ncbi:hypothetical protein [Glaciibacter sp. 2TAF33]|uniref:aggregation-promoting factor C-terminal-like domain-containing protein n=1 Tax=Glaciibacter sp. 2TAF33 TaxID=3233015 RepID=UPI003F9108F0